MYQYPYGNAQQLNLDWILSKIQELESGSGGGDADLEEIANVLVSASFDAGVSYRMYDYCFYNGKLYRALNDTSGAFNPADWSEITLGADIPVLTRLLNAVDTSLTSLQTTVGNQGTAITNLQNAVGSLDSDDVDNASLVVSGATVTAALDALSGAISTEATARQNVDDGLAIVANGNVHYAALTGQFILVRNNQTLTDGLYIATETIPTNQPLTASNTTPASTVSGALNGLQNESATGYCKMPDGTAIAWGNVSGLTFSSESIKEGTVTLPFAFVSGNVHTTPYNTSNQNYMFFCGASLQGGAGDTLAWTLATITGNPISIANRGFAWLAIGRWK